ncbi:hypothetical protein BC938DRAFT_482529, partial [Jimgerdemannia flammicorona]
NLGLFPNNNRLCSCKIWYSFFCRRRRIEVRKDFARYERMRFSDERVSYFCASFTVLHGTVTTIEIRPPTPPTERTDSNTIRDVKTTKQRNTTTKQWNTAKAK